MKSCNYFYKGKLIGDIIKLDDFLLSGEKYYAGMSDQVFQRQYTKDDEKVQKVTNTLNKAKRDNLEVIKKWSEAKKQMINDEELIKLKRPLVGVTEFLSGQTDSNGKLYFPEFDEGQYWSRRFYAWTSGKRALEPNGSDGFTQAEIDLFFDSDESKITAVPLGNDRDWKNADGTFKADPDNRDRVKFGTDEQNRLRELMEDKWKHQATYGTEIHNVLQKFFSYSKDGKNMWGDLLTGPQASMHLAKFEEGLRKDPNSGITDNTSHERVLEIIDYGKKLIESLEKKFIDRKTHPEGKLRFFPEYTLSAKLNKEYEGRTDLSITGRVDLIVLDPTGVPHIIDYKTSPKPYDEYSGAKKLGFTYQLATYERMLRRLNISTSSTELIVAPIKMDNFRKDGDKWIYDHVTPGSMEVIKPITDEANRENIINNLNDYIEEPQVLEGTAVGMIEKVKKTFEEWIPNYGSTQVRTDEEIINLIKKQKADQPNDKGQYVYQPKNSRKEITAKSESELFKKVKNYYTSSKEKASRDAERIIAAINKAKKDGSNQIGLKYTDDWLRNSLSKYLHDSWEVMDDDAAKAARHFGMIMFYNRDLDLVNVVRLSSSYDLTKEFSFGQNRTNLTGAFETDTVENSKSDSFALKSVNGNIELMETMLVLNALEYGRDIRLGSINIMHMADRSDGISASNKELMYNWRKFTKFKPLDYEDRFKSGKVKMITKAEACWEEFRDIMNRNLNNDLTTALQDQLEYMQSYHDNLPSDPERALYELNKLRLMLEKDFGMHKVMQGDNNYHSGVRNYDQDQERILYQHVMAAMLELRNFPIRQALKDHKNFLEHYNIITKGISGNMLDNAGNFGNQMLNQITSLALEGYQNARDAAYRLLNTSRLKTEQLKKDLGYSGLVEHTYGNQTSLYQGMIEHTSDGDLRFVNPWKDNTLHPAQAEYLKYAILEINKLRYKGLTQEAIKAKIDEGDPEFFQVPLLEASFASKVQTEGWKNWLKNKLGRFSSKERILETFRDFQSEFFDDEQEKQSVDEDIFKVINMMTQGSSDRKKTIEDKTQKYGEGFFERDIEAILSQMIWAYSTDEALSERMPLIKAAYISLNVMGNEQNYSFKNDEEFYRKFVANRINHKSIEESDSMKELKGAVGMVQAATSWMALAFSPTQFSYQSIEGIWKACKLIITKPDGTETFTAKNMYDAAKTVYNELFHYSDMPSVATAINAQYGINDMDNASFAENNTSNKHGIFNFFTKFAYRFSSRPDFYNRMTIFVAQMKADGSWQAHSIDKKTGELIYEYEKDERFKAFATNDKRNMEAYNKAKAMYYTVAQQLVNEGARNKDGSLFTIGQPLPKAYSNRESEAKKAVGDNMYGYYDSTKKSLWQATFLGGLMMQMRTYWSAKKNQYFAPGGIKAQGKWVQLESEVIDPETHELKRDSEGKIIMEKYYYPKNEKGEIDVNGTPVPESDPNRSDVPFLQWKGKFEEGVILTIAGILNDIRTMGYKKMVEARFGKNADPELKQVYIANLRLFITDLVMWGVIGMGATMMLGDWADEEKKEAKESGHMSDAINATWANFVHKTIKSSGLDFAWWQAIFDVSMDWNPMAISYLGNEIAVLADFIFGDEEFSNVIVRSFSAARQVRPIIDCIKND